MSGPTPERLRVVLNAANITAAGPTALVGSLVGPLVRALEPAEITLVVAAGSPLAALGSHGTELVEWNPGRGVGHDLRRLAQLHLRLPALARRRNADVLLTLGDVGPVRVPCPHVIFLHLALLVYGADELAGAGWPPLKRRYLTAHFAASARRAAAVVVQTPVMAQRAVAAYGLDARRVREIRQPLPGHARVAPEQPLEAMAALTKPVRLLVLGAYYPHKNHALLPGLARELRRRGLAERVQIFTTVAPRTLPPALAGEFDMVRDLVTNLGPLQPDLVPAALAASTALLLPTLAESYGLTYLEAMAAGRAILTSDRDFAHWMCGDLARYFDPLSAGAAADAIEALIASPPDPGWAVRARSRLADFPADWDETAAAFAGVLREVAGSGS